MASCNLWGTIRLCSKEPFEKDFKVVNVNKQSIGHGNFDQAEALLKQALSQMQQLGMTWHITYTNYDLAKLYRAKDNPTKAQEQLCNSAPDVYELGSRRGIENDE